MPSPFPGMDPYLEGYLWPDVHQALASKIRQILTPMLRPRYAARLGVYLVEDTSPESDTGIMYPDVEVMLTGATPAVPNAPPPAAATVPAESRETPATLSIPLVLPLDVQVTNVEIRDAADNQLITRIEILSPVNKREPGLTQYRQKRQRLHQAGVHLVELDLLRRGVRPVAHPRIGDVAYLISLTRAHTAKTHVWAHSLQEPLPTTPVPLRPPDDDVLLDIAAAFRAVYDEAAYDLSVDYGQLPPPPQLAAADVRWMRERISQMKRPFSE